MIDIDITVNTFNEPLYTRNPDLKGFASVTVWIAHEVRLELRGVRLLADRIEIPQKPKRMPNGETRWQAIVNVDSRLKELIYEAVLKAYRQAFTDDSEEEVPRLPSWPGGRR